MLREIWFWIRHIGCRLFGLHSRPGILLGRDILDRKADVISDVRPTMILRRARVAEERACRWCGTMWTRIGWERVVVSDPSPRAPGEEGATIQ